MNKKRVVIVFVIAVVCFVLLGTAYLLISTKGQKFNSTSQEKNSKLPKQNVSQSSAVKAPANQGKLLDAPNVPKPLKAITVEEVEPVPSTKEETGVCKRTHLGFRATNQHRNRQ